MRVSINFVFNRFICSDESFQKIFFIDFSFTRGFRKDIYAEDVIFKFNSHRDTRILEFMHYAKSLGLTPVTEHMVSLLGSQPKDTFLIKLSITDEEEDFALADHIWVDSRKYGFGFPGVLVNGNVYVENYSNLPLVKTAFNCGAGILVSSQTRHKLFAGASNVVFAPVYGCDDLKSYADTPELLPDVFLLDSTIDYKQMYSQAVVEIFGLPFSLCIIDDDCPVVDFFVKKSFDDTLGFGERVMRNHLSKKLADHMCGPKDPFNRYRSCLNRKLLNHNIL